MHFSVWIEVAVSGQFFGWIMALGNGVKVVGPECVVNQMRNWIEQIGQMYENTQEMRNCYE